MIFAVWEGGMSFSRRHAGVPSRSRLLLRNAIPLLGFADRIAVVAPSAWARAVANFINGELWAARAGVAALGNDLSARGMAPDIQPVVQALLEGLVFLW